MGPEGHVPVTPPLGGLSLGQAVHLHSPLGRPVPHRVFTALLPSTSLPAFPLPWVLLWPLLSSVTQEEIILSVSVFFLAGPGPCFFHPHLPPLPHPAASSTQHDAHQPLNQRGPWAPWSALGHQQSHWPTWPTPKTPMVEKDKGQAHRGDLGRMEVGWLLIGHV